MTGGLVAAICARFHSPSPQQLMECARELERSLPWRVIFKHGADAARLAFLFTRVGLSVGGTWEPVPFSQGSSDRDVRAISL